LKDEALDRTLWRTRFTGSYGHIIQTRKWSPMAGFVKKVTCLDSINWREFSSVTDVIQFSSKQRIFCIIIMQITGKDVKGNGCDVTQNTILPCT
jgi:hypothetical protein